jgi:hypothetical protein
MKVLLDNDVILDYMLERQPFFVEAEEIFMLNAKKKITVFVSAITPVNVFYTGRKLKGKEFTLKAVRRLLLLVEVCRLDKKILQSAFTLNFTDYEDAVQKQSMAEIAKSLKLNYGLFRKAVNLQRFRLIKFLKKIMKIQKSLSVLIILFASIQICFAQETPKAKLLDEFGEITSEDFVARLDYLWMQLAEQPNSTAYVVIHNGKISNDRQRFRYEQWAKGHIKDRRFDENRIFIIRAKDKDELHIQIWLVPEGAEKPEYTEAVWNLKLSPNAKPFLWTATKWQDGLSTPPEYLSLNLFSEYLSSNPTSRGNFVVFAKSKKEFYEEQEKITNFLVEKYGISRKRLRFFYFKEKHDYPQVEVWLLP